jgi:hypothetical protein
LFICFGLPAQTPNLTFLLSAQESSPMKIMEAIDTEQICPIRP